MSSPPELSAHQRGTDPSPEDSGSEEPGGGHVALPSGRSAATRAYRLAEVADVLGFTDEKPPLPAETWVGDQTQIRPAAWGHKSGSLTLKGLIQRAPAGTSQVTVNRAQGHSSPPVPLSSSSWLSSASLSPPPHPFLLPRSAPPAPAGVCLSLRSGEQEVPGQRKTGSRKGNSPPPPAWRSSPRWPK